MFKVKLNKDTVYLFPNDISFTVSKEGIRINKDTNYCWVKNPKDIEPIGTDADNILYQVLVEWRKLNNV